MTDMFLLLCASIAATLEAVKPVLRTTLGISVDDEPTPLYQTLVWVLAAVFGVVGAFLFQVNVAPTWFGLPLILGYVFTGIVASFGSEVAHRILEVLEAISGIFQNKAEPPAEVQAVEPHMHDSVEHYQRGYDAGVRSVVKG